MTLDDTINNDYFPYKKEDLPRLINFYYGATRRMIEKGYANEMAVAAYKNLLHVNKTIGADLRNLEYDLCSYLTKEAGAYKMNLCDKSDYSNGELKNRRSDKNYYKGNYLCEDYFKKSDSLKKPFSSWSDLL